MKILKKIFGFKFTVYVWAIAIAILVFIGAYFLGVSNSNSKGNQATESYSMVKYIEKVNQVVCRNSKNRYYFKRQKSVWLGNSIF